jgi:hypothetical protein
MIDADYLTELEHDVQDLTTELKAATARIERLEAKNRKLTNGMFGIVDTCKWGAARTPSMCFEGEYCICRKAFTSMDYNWGLGDD